MATEIQHSLIAEAYLHEPKGASLASADTYCKANGDGTTTFSPLPSYDIAVEDVLTLESYDDQTLNSPGTEINLHYSTSDVVSPNGHISVDTIGNITINTDGVYHIQGIANFGRTTSAGTASLAVALRLNGVQAGKSTYLFLADAIDGPYVVVSTGSVGSFSAGDVLTYAMLCETVSSGEVGALTKTLPFAGWKDVSSVKLTVTKLGVN